MFALRYRSVMLETKWTYLGFLLAGSGRFGSGGNITPGRRGGEPRDYQQELTKRTLLRRPGDMLKGC